VLRSDHRAFRRANAGSRQQKMKRVVTVVCLIILSLLINSTIEAQNLKSSRRSEKTQIPSVKYGSVQAVSDGQGVYLKWQTDSETKNVGFLIYRISDGQKELVSPKLIAGSYLTSGEEKSIGNSYDFFDASGDLNAIYVIESLDVNDQKAISNAFAPEYVADLAGFSPAADLLIKESKRAEAVYEQEKLNLPRDLASEMKSNSFAADVNNQRIIAALPGVKIGVKDEGIYRVTRSRAASRRFRRERQQQFVAALFERSRAVYHRRRQRRLYRILRKGN
jgi:hypothetical protein